MDVVSKLATSLGKRNDVPNEELAQQIAGKKDSAAVQALVDNLHNKNKGIQSDCIKTLYEIGERNAELITGHTKEFIALLDSKNNRMQWGAMTALSAIAAVNPRVVYPALGRIVTVADNGSIISRDHAVKILVNLCSVKQYEPDVFPLYNEQLLAAPENQFPTYAELGIPIINDSNRAVFLKTLISRLDGIESETKKKRVEKVIKKMNQQIKK